LGVVAHEDYSSTPLYKKLGIREGSVVSVVRAPNGLKIDLPSGARMSAGRSGSLDVALLFTTTEKDLGRGGSPR
jgi:hypothetical protein